MSCGCGSGSGLPSRYTDDGTFQVSYDGGVTWVDTPEGDYRNTVTLFPPLSGADGNDKKCQTATNIRGHMEHNADQLAADAEAWGELALLIAAIAALAIFMFPVSLALAASTPFWIGLGGALLTVGQAGFEAAMTTAVFDTLECILYCNMQDDGTFTDDDITVIKAEISTQLTGVAVPYLTGVIDGLGKTALANMGRTGAGLAADCSDCDCFNSCASGWIIRPDLVDYMDITEVGEDFLVVNVHTPLSNGVYYANVLSSGGENDCCYFNSFEVLTGAVAGIAGVDCGGTGLPAVGIWTGHCVNHLEPQSNVPFSIKLFLTPCP